MINRLDTLTEMKTLSDEEWMDISTFLTKRTKLAIENSGLSKEVITEKLGQINYGVLMNQDIWSIITICEVCLKLKINLSFKIDNQIVDITHNKDEI